MKCAERFVGMAAVLCGLWVSGVRGEMLAEYTYDAGANFNPQTQGWTLADGTEEDVNFFNSGGTSLLLLESAGDPNVLFSQVIPVSAFESPWSFTGNNRFAGNSQEEFGLFMFVDDGTNLWHMSFYNHGSDATDGIYMGGDPLGPVLDNTATKVLSETAPDNLFDSFHDWALVDADGAGPLVPTVKLDGQALEPAVFAIPAPSRFPAGTVGWGSLNPNEAGFFQTRHMAFEVVDGSPGDFDDDGDVDGADFLRWQLNFGAPDETSLNGNGDGIDGVDDGDLALWKTNFGQAGALTAASSVPEPATFVLLAYAAASLRFASKRRRLNCGTRRTN